MDPETVWHNLAQSGITNSIITDHHDDTGVPFLQDFKIRDPQAYVEFFRSRGRPVGIEYGWDGRHPHSVDLKQFDFVILSVHTFENSEEPEHIDFGPYLETVLRCVKGLEHFTVLGHLDFPRRYIPSRRAIGEEHYPLVREIFRELVRRGKGIEVNTGGMRDYGEPNPDWNLVQLYRECGGQILTMGSDAHVPEHVGLGIPEATRKILQMGFSALWTWKGDRFELVPLD